MPIDILSDSLSLMLSIYTSILSNMGFLLNMLERTSAYFGFFFREFRPEWFVVLIEFLPRLSF